MATLDFSQNRFLRSRSQCRSASRFPVQQQQKTPPSSPLPLKKRDFYLTWFNPNIDLQKLDPSFLFIRTSWWYRQRFCSHGIRIRIQVKLVFSFNSFFSLQIDSNPSSLQPTSPPPVLLSCFRILFTITAPVIKCICTFSRGHRILFLIYLS